MMTLREVRLELRRMTLSSIIDDAARRDLLELQIKLLAAQREERKARAAASGKPLQKYSEYALDQKIRRDYERGYAPAAIAEVMGVSEERVTAAIKRKSGVTAR